jgi:hypothetical protein
MSDLEDELIREEARRRGISETMLRMLKAAPTNLVRDVVFDHVGKRDVLQPSSIIPENNRSTPVERGSGWQSERPIRPPEGIEHVDALCQAQDEREQRRAALDAAYETEMLLRVEQRRRDRELDPCNTGIYKTKDQLDRGE